MTANTQLTPAQKAHRLKDFFQAPAVQAKMRELLDKNAASFATSAMQIANSNPMLLDAEPMSIFNAAVMAATLNLPINNNLGFAYIVPYRNKGRVEAQFQLGYKGFIQLAQRSGQFERLVSLPVYEAQLIEEDPINGFKFDWKQKPAENKQPVGYYAYFKLINGFTSELCMTREQVAAHAGRYSQSFKKGYGVLGGQNPIPQIHRQRRHRAHRLRNRVQRNEDAGRQSGRRGRAAQSTTATAGKAATRRARAAR